MLCNRCPHHVRHGKVATDGKTIEFDEKCGLKMSENKKCLHHPFGQRFNYRTCDVYYQTFKSSLDRNAVVPREDIEYSDQMGVSSITEMELL